MENVRNRINVKLVNNKKDYLKCTSKPSYMLQKIFDNNLVAIHISKITSILNKPAHITITLKISMTTTKNYYSPTLTVQYTKLKLKMSLKILAVIFDYLFD